VNQVWKRITTLLLIIEEVEAELSHNYSRIKLTDSTPIQVQWQFASSKKEDYIWAYIVQANPMGQ